MFHEPPTINGWLARHGDIHLAHEIHPVQRDPFAAWNTLASVLLAALAGLNVYLWLGYFFT